MQEVDLDSFLDAHSSGAYVVDVRESHEYHRGHVPGAQLMPLGVVPLRLHELPKDQPVYVICASGHRSLTAAQHMSRVGVDARSVRGGTVAWARAGRTLEFGLPE
ncbi:MAG: rhodanese-like domain-containing protein [Candidatus Dormibacteraeota bacterium]|nr:rhodanese-like domain-containing protein [Candidatus Dormibacteraeota bacterium]